MPLPDRICCFLGVRNVELSIIKYSRSCELRWPNQQIWCSMLTACLQCKVSCLQQNESCAIMFFQILGDFFRLYVETNGENEAFLYTR